MVSRPHGTAYDEPLVVYDTASSDLTNEKLHNSLSGTELHDPKAHASNHLPGGSDALTTAAAGAIQPDDTSAEGTAESFARSDHKHAITAGTPVSISGANAEGTSTSFARADHVHAHPSGLGEDLHHKKIYGCVQAHIGGVVNDAVNQRMAEIPLNGFPQDVQFVRISASVGPNGPGTDQTITAEVTDGTSVLSCQITGADTEATGDTTQFTLDTSAESLTFQYDSTSNIDANARDLHIWAFYLPA